MLTWTEPSALSKDPGWAGGGEGAGVCICTEAKDGNSGSCLLRGFRGVVLFSEWSWGHRYQNHGGWTFIQLGCLLEKGLGIWGGPCTSCGVRSTGVE